MSYHILITTTDCGILKSPKIMPNQPTYGCDDIKVRYQIEKFIRTFMKMKEVTNCEIVAL